MRDTATPSAPLASTAAADEATRLGRVLAHEHRTGCADLAVVGGLDGLLGRLGEQAAVRRVVASLPPGGYRSLAGSERDRWLQASRVLLGAQPTGAGARPARPGGAPAERLALSEAGTGLSDRQLARLTQLGVDTVADALHHYPFRYHDFSRTTPVAALRAGERQTVRGAVVGARATRTGRGLPACEATISDAQGSRLRVLWFRQPWPSRTSAPRSPPGARRS